LWRRRVPYPRDTGAARFDHSMLLGDYLMSGSLMSFNVVHLRTRPLSVMSSRLQIVVMINLSRGPTKVMPINGRAASVRYLTFRAVTLTYIKLESTKEHQVRCSGAEKSYG
jgi:hypothetical protein